MNTNGFEIDPISIAEGAAGKVHKATLLEPRYDLNTGDVIAVKLIKKEILKHGNEPERLKREYKIGSSISHPHLVKIYELIEPSETIDSYVLVMELVEGQRLSEAIKGRLPLETKLSIGTEICQAVAELHQRQILHRDLKPDNIIISTVGSPKVVDYGVSKILGEPSITQRHEFLGTLRFSSPQAVEGQKATAADDIYSLGTVFYELFSGTEIFHEIDNKALLTDAIRSTLPDVCDINIPVKEFPYYLRILIQKMLIKEAEDRPDIDEVYERMSSRVSDSYIAELETVHLEHYRKELAGNGDEELVDSFAFTGRCTECRQSNFYPVNELRYHKVDPEALFRAVEESGSVYMSMFCYNCQEGTACRVTIP